MAKPRLSLFNSIVFLLNNIFALALLVSYLGWFVNPSKIPIMGVISLSVPVFMAINLVFVLYWILLRRKQMMLSIICLAVGWWHFNALYQFGNSVSYHFTKPPISVMTYNVHNYYPNHPWKKTYVPKEKMAGLVEEANPDILCMQEFQNVKPWVPGYLKFKTITKNHDTQLAIYSRYKMLKTNVVNYPNKKGAYQKFMYADILVNDDTVRVVNVHLASIALDNADLRTFKDIDQADQEKIEKSGKQIFSRLIDGYKKRGTQVNSVDSFVTKSPYPIILCGDFNDTPTSYSYKKLTTHLEDAYTQAGHGLHATHPRFDRYKIPVRIDHIFSSSKFQATNWQVIQKEYSDHYPVLVNFMVK